MKDIVLSELSKMLLARERRAREERWGRKYVVEIAWMRHILLLVEQIMVNTGKKKTKRAPTEYQRFVGERTREGESIQEAAAEWRAR